MRYIRPAHVYHVASSNFYDSGASPELPGSRRSCSREGMALSVSSTPEFWREILQLKGPTYELTRKDGERGKFAVYCNDLVNSAISFAEANGFISWRNGYKAKSSDGRIVDVFFDDLRDSMTYAKAYGLSVVTTKMPYPNKKFIERWMKFFSEKPEINSSFVTWCATPEYVNIMLEEKFQSMDGFWLNDKILHQVRGNILRHRFSFWQVM